MNDGRTYLCIDLKSFYASVECVERGLDPLTTDLVVADPERTEKTICLAVSPSLKARGVSGRARVFEIPESFSYIMAPPRMAKYVEYSANIYAIYLRYFSKDDIHVYSIDEAFMDVTNYLSLYDCTARELGERIRREVLDEVGIPATCGLGPNLYLAKLALDITAKHSPDFFGELTEETFRETLWDHKPLTDFWRIGRGTERRLHELGIHTMGELALYPDLERLYDVFGIDAEILIDHAWGIEPVGIADIKAYRAQSHSMTNAQMLGCAYSFDDALLVAKEMADASCLEMVAEGVVADSVTLNVRYDRDAAARSSRPYDPADPRNYTTDGRGTVRFPQPTNSREIVMELVVELFERVVDPGRMVHNIMLNFNNVVGEGREQLSLFVDEESASEERSRQEAILDIKRKFGKNSLLKGIDLMPQATQRERNRQIGGHKSGE
ncbi:MAG: DNA repair protein [Eggerthellaceae bacterium]|nr:DNA repair protein [Eggerthellaceae bacterium]